MIKQKIGIYSVLHFMVDFCCAYFMFQLAAVTESFYIYFLIYNFCAFALQMPTGLLADKWNHNSIVASTGCFLTGIVALFAVLFLREGAQTWLHLIVVSVVGIGNCLFHVGGGIETLNESDGKLSMLGIFVSPGAIGIYLGTLLGKREVNWGWIFFVFLVLGGVLLLCWHKQKEKQFVSGNVPLDGEWNYTKAEMIAALFCFFVVVVLRSHLGMVYTFPWKVKLAGAVLGLAAVVLGKASGGFWADKIGIGKAILVSMSAATLCFCFAENMFFGIIGLFFFNMSMPMTLYLAAVVLSRCKGFAFGLLTFAIFIGFLPAYFGYRQCREWLLVIISLISLLLLYAGWYLTNKRREKEEKWLK